MGFFRDASDFKARFNRSAVALGLVLLFFGYLAYEFYWKNDPIRDGAENFVRRDPAIAQAAGEIRRINLKTIVGGACKTTCPTYIFSVVGTRALVPVSVASWSGPDGKPQFRILRPEAGR